MFKVGDIVRCNKGFTFDPCIGIIKWVDGRRPNMMCKVLVLLCINPRHFSNTQRGYSGFKSQSHLCWWYDAKYLTLSDMLTIKDAEEIEKSLISNAVMENL